MSKQAAIEDLLDEFYEIMEKGWHLPMSGGKVMINGDEAKEIIEELRETIPDEISKAKGVLADRDQIIVQAQKEAERMMEIAEQRAKQLVSQDEIVRQAQAKANDLIIQGQVKHKEMRKAANDYIDDIMKRADMSVSETLAELRRTRQNIQQAQRNS